MSTPTNHAGKARAPPKHKATHSASERMTMKRVLRALKERKGALRKKCAKRRMTSFTNSNISYIVTKKSCTCNDYIFRRKAKGEACKHIRELLKVIESDSKPTEKKTNKPTKFDLQDAVWTQEDSEWMKSVQHICDE
jgi:predicted nucleic acid-binding Zn finger protein